MKLIDNAGQLHLCGERKRRLHVVEEVSVHVMNWYSDVKFAKMQDVFRALNESPARFY